MAECVAPHTSPAVRPLQTLSQHALALRLQMALEHAHGVDGAHCIHELWMRGELPARIELALERLWQRAAARIPDWLPMRYIDWLPALYAVAGRFCGQAAGRHNIYLVLLDYTDRSGAPYGVYVGMSIHAAARRFDQHKAGIHAAGSVLKRGIEVLTGPALHLRHLARAEAARIEADLAEALRMEGLLVQGGH